MTRKDREIAIKMRREGKSYNEIKEKMNISKSTLSAWLSPEDWSQNITQALTKEALNKSIINLQTLNKIRGKHLEKIYAEAEQEAIDEFHRLKYHPLFIAGLMLYWGEGDKVTKYFVRITNTDPLIIKIFANFLIHICGIEKSKISCGLLLYPDLIETDCKKYWVEKSGIEGIKFHKSQIIHGKHKTNRLPYGVCMLAISSTYFKKKMLTWVRLFGEELISPEYYKLKL